MNPALEIGKTFGGGRYVVEQVLGIGGFGITYYVRHVELGVHYAVKEFFISGKCVRESDRSTVLLQNIDQSRYAKLKKRFADEARTLVVLNNPHVVKVIDIFEENNTSYIVMEYVPGITLQQKVDNTGKMSVSDAVNCMGQLAEAVSYIHEKHILHRDIKPDNVMITPDNRIVLVDFGSAREFVHDEVQNQTAILTHGYAPIEQYAANGKKGNYTDIYAMGGVFYFALTGEKPMDATSRTMEQLKSPKELNPEVPDKVSKTVMKAMEMKAEDRYQTVQEFMSDLLGDKHTGQANTLSRDKDVKKKKLPLVLGIVALVVAVIMLVVLLPKKEQTIVEDQKQTELMEPAADEPIYYSLSTGEEYMYEGETDSLNVPNGYGKATFSDRVYVGYFTDGDMNGLGKLTFGSGKIIQGSFVDNKVLDSCIVRSGIYEFRGTLMSDLEFGNGINKNTETGDEYEYVDGGITRINGEKIKQQP